MNGSSLHWAYCLNAVTGEGWGEQADAVRAWPVAPGGGGLGLWLSDRAAREALEPGVADAFREACVARGQYVFTLNGFPFGRFHGGPVKAAVYRPDWTDPQRRWHTGRLAALLAGWLPEGVGGSISTVPGWYRADYPDHAAEAAARVATEEALLAMAAELEQLAATRGRDLCLGLEPEPGCAMQDQAGIERFFRGLFARAAAAGQEASVRRRIGLCLDTCHAALAFEDPLDWMACAAREGIRLAKIQVSAALLLTRPDAVALARLSAFDEPVYLHQAAARRGAERRTWPDLPDALAELTGGPGVDELRVHMHVPLDWSGDGVLGSTRDRLTPAFWRAVADGACPHLEVETYTYAVLPPSFARAPLAECAARELAWARDQVDRAAACS